MCATLVTLPVAPSGSEFAGAAPSETASAGIPVIAAGAAAAVDPVSAATSPCPPAFASVLLRWRGVEPYQVSFDAMRAFTEARTAETADEIWLVEHPPVFTLGQAGDPAHLLAADSGIPLVKVDRGGQITYHGPGQVVAYLLLDLRRRKLMVRELVTRIEAAVIETLAAYNLAGERKAGAPGIYVAPQPEGGQQAGEQQAGGEQQAWQELVQKRVQQAAPHANPDANPDASPHAGAKIAALGLKIRNGCSYHGVSLNVNMDLQPFLAINPCGYAGLETVDMTTLGVHAGWTDVARTLAARLTANIDGAYPAAQSQAGSAAA